MSNPKYYRVKKDTFMWTEGAILKSDYTRGCRGGYQPINDIWDHTSQNGDEYISTPIIENNPDWFERVYEMGSAEKMLFVTKEKAQELSSKFFKK